MRIWRDYRFEASHCLPNVPAGHKCGRMHGHSYRVRVWVEGPVDPVMGWVIDFADIDRLWALQCQFDHTCLNTVLPNPTSELLAKHIFDALQPLVASVEVSETDRSGAVWP